MQGGAGFYLITTDILGPYGVGFAIGTLGWGPGIVLYTVFGTIFRSPELLSNY